MEGSKRPSSVWEFLGIYVPDVVTFRLGLFPFFIETGDVRLVPKIGSNLRGSQGECSISDNIGDRLTFFMGILSSG